MYKLTVNPLSLDGSSDSGNCSSFVITREGQTCNTPRNSILFDGVIPSLTGINNSMCWASQLLVLQRTITITFTFTQPMDVNGTDIRYPGVGTIEIVMFNCPSRQVGAPAILILDGIANKITILRQITIRQHTSCDSLVRICVHYTTGVRVIGLAFVDPLNYIYLAEVTFYINRNPRCRVGPVDTSTTSTTPTCSSTTTHTANTEGIIYVTLKEDITSNNLFVWVT